MDACPRRQRRAATALPQLVLPLPPLLLQSELWIVDGNIAPLARSHPQVAPPLVRALGENCVDRRREPGRVSPEHPVLVAGSGRAHNRPLHDATALPPLRCRGRFLIVRLGIQSQKPSSAQAFAFRSMGSIAPRAGITDKVARRWRRLDGGGGSAATRRQCWRRRLNNGGGSTTVEAAARRRRWLDGGG
jgi:hypothetical protein